jgi:membrane protein required for colicin V production
MENLILTDYIFLFIAFVSTIFGFARGFLREVFTILNLTLAIIAASLLAPTAAKFFAQHLKDPMWIQAAAWIGSYILCWVIIAVVNSFVIDALKFIRGGFIDRIMGIALGLARGALIVVGIYLGVVITVNAQHDESKLPSWLAEAKTLNYIKVQSTYVLAMMPKEYQDFYKNQNTTISTALFDSGKELIDTAKTPKLTEMGFDAPQIQTLQDLLSNVDGSLKVEDMNGFSPDTIKMLGDQAIEDYERNISSGVSDGISDTKSSAKKLTQEQIQSLKDQLSKIKVKDAW